ncbi:response regulator [Chloroflexota bacterium]
MSSRKILVVDDEKKILEIIGGYLLREGFQVVNALDGQSALETARRESPNLIILDLMLPKVSGWDVCRQLRTYSNTPIIMLTARDDTTDKIVGLELGADDYVTKPFNPKELMSRVKAVLRRFEASQKPPKTINVRDITIDTEKRSVCRGQTPVELTPYEFDILSTLAESPGRVFSRAQLLDHVQGDLYEGYDRTIDSHVKNLRKKLELSPEHPTYILTVYGIGYKLEAVEHA